MRTILALSLLALMAASGAAAQQWYGAPRGSYERQCTNIRMEGQFLSAYCRGSRGAGESSINVLSCSTDIGVDPSGGLACIGPGGGAPPSVRDAPPGYYTGPPPGYGSGYGGRGGSRRDAVTLFSGLNWRGLPVRIEGAAPDLGGNSLNDRVRSIRLERGSPPWIVCTDAEYRGRCLTINRSVADTRQIGMLDAISSLRPAW
jgi:hypothetical protein